MKNITKPVFILAALLTASPALASDATLPQNENSSVNIVSAQDVNQLKTVFDAPIDLDMSLIKTSTIRFVTPDIDDRDEIYNDNIDMDYNLTDTAFIGVAKIGENNPDSWRRGGYPEGIHVNQFNSLAGGGVKTTF